MKTYLNNIIPKSHRHLLRFWLELLIVALLMPFMYTFWELQWAYGKVRIALAIKSEEERVALKRIGGIMSPLLKDWQAWLLYPIILVVLGICILLVLAVTLFYSVVELKQIVTRRYPCSCEQ